jgi:anti-sigma factor RsiW
MAPGFEGHLGDRLSALLDGELRPDEVAAARAHLAGCATCAAELEAVDAARDVVRSMPLVEPPPGFLDGLVPPLPPVVPLRRRNRSAVLSAVASVAASLVVLAMGAGSVQSLFEPSVPGAVDDHVATAAALDLGGPSLRETESPVTTEAPRAVEELPAPYRAPLELDGGYRLVEAFGRGQVVHLVYERDGGRHALSVFEAPGRVDWDAVPDGGERLEEAGVTAWIGDPPGPGGHVVVLELDGLAATVVGDEGADEVLAAALSLPEPRELSMLQKLRQACAEALDGLSPLG